MRSFDFAQDDRKKKSGLRRYIHDDLMKARRA